MVRIREKQFFIALSLTLGVCACLTLYCAVNGQAMAATHREPQYALRNIQLIIAAAAAAFIAARPQTRKVWYMYSIPLILCVFAFLYVWIVNQYPCCIGG